MQTEQFNIEITPNARGLVTYALQSDISDWNTETRKEAIKMYQLAVNFPTLSAHVLLGVVRGTHEFAFSDNGNTITAIREL